jgi:hypothetical protein
VAESCRLAALIDADSCAALSSLVHCLFVGSDASASLQRLAFRKKLFMKGSAEALAATHGPAVAQANAEATARE